MQVSACFFWRFSGVANRNRRPIRAASIRAPPTNPFRCGLLFPPQTRGKKRKKQEKTRGIGNLVLTRENKKTNTGGGMEENKNNLFAGGQGHSEKEVEETAISCSILFFAFLVSLIIFVIASAIFATR